MAYLNIRDACKHVGKTEKTLRRWVHSGKIPYRVDSGKLYFDVTDLDRMRDSNIPAADNEALLARIESIEKRLQEIENQVQQKPIPVTPAPPPAPLRPTRLVHNGGQLPDGLVGFRQFADAHNIAHSTVQRAVENGRLEVVRGKWKVGRAWVEMALDQPGRRRFFDLFFENPGFKACPQCPHDV